MRKLRWLMAALLAVASTPLAMVAQQSGTIAGRVVTAEGQQPLSGVQVVVGGTNRGTRTDQQGRYTIPGVPAGTHRIRASVLGFQQGEQTVTVAAGGVATANFSLATSALELTGIVVNPVTGQVERKRELGTNTASIGAAELEKAPITKMADVLTGRAAGVTLQGVAGTTGTSQRIRIRGANSLSLSNEPLIYVDGVLFSNSKGISNIYTGGQDASRLNDLNPEDIDKVEILKGPAASALYGTAAANGVVLITTKKGRAGGTVWRAYAETGRLEDRTDYPKVFLALQERNASSANADPFTATGGLNTAAFSQCPNVLRAEGRCRQDRLLSLAPFETEPFNPFSTGNRQKYGLSASGGGEQVTFYLSGDFEDERGVIRSNTADKVNLRANLNAKLRDNWDIQVNSGYTDSNLVLNSNDNSIFSPIINAVLAQPFIPTPEQLAASSPLRRPGFGFGFSPEDLEELVATQSVDRFIVGLQTNYRPTSWLSANGSVGLDYFGRADESTIQPGRAPIAASFTPGNRTSTTSQNYLYTANGSGTATFDLSGDVASTSTLGGSYTRELFENVNCFGVGIVEGTRSCSATSSLFAVNEAFSEVKTVGGFFQQQFAFRDRVFLAGSIRGDNNSAFGQDFGFIYYPSASLSWVVSEEPFFSPASNVFSNLRLRAAVGTSGLRPGFRDAVTLLAPVSATVDNQELSAVTLSRTGNPQLEPERTTEYELGFDTGIFDDRLSVEFTYYNKESRDALISRRLAPSFGLTGSIFDNLGRVSNSGTETALNARLLEFPNARLNVRVSATTLENRIEELGEGVEPIIFGRGNQRHQEGFPAGAFFQRRFTFNDANGDGLLSRSEVQLEGDTAVFLGSSLPTNTQSLSADMTIFGWLTVSTLFDRRGGLKQLNSTEEFRCRFAFMSSGRGSCAGVADPNASQEEQARFIASRFLGTRAGYIEDADFVKWRELAFTLGVPQSWSRNLPAIEGASLTLSGRNLATWTDYSGLDPEINESGGDSNFTQGEFNTQPPVRYFTARLNFTF